MKCSLSISNYLEEISSLSRSIVCIYFFALITEKVFLISPHYSSELCIQTGISFLFSFSLLFTAICKASSDNHFAFLHLFFEGWSWSLAPIQCHEPAVYKIGNENTLYSKINQSYLYIHTIPFGFPSHSGHHYGWRFITLYRRWWSKPSSRKRNAKGKWLSEEALQIIEKRRKAKGKGEKGRYTHLNAEFQRIARRDKKAFLSKQCKEIE